MSKEKEKKRKKGSGGARPGAGHPKTGVTKEKICISIDRHIWQAARKSWSESASRLIEMLVSAHVRRNNSNQNLEAI
jgi:hypothetical protein